MTRILLFGATGQLGRELADRGPELGVTVDPVPRAQADLGDPAAAARAILAADSCEVVVNAAAYTGVDQAESETAAARAVNALSPGAMAQACARRGARFIHVSSDYVFDGSSDRPYGEDDPPSPLNSYGRSKLEGERRVLEADPSALVVRTSWLFSPHRSNFVKTMLHLGERLDQVHVVDDQTSRPTYAGDLADFIARICRGRAETGSGLSGLLHFAGRGAVSRIDFARAIFDLAPARRRPRIVPIASRAFGADAQRPARSILSTTRYEALFGAPPDWRAGLLATLVRLSEAAPA